MRGTVRSTLHDETTGNWLVAVRLDDGTLVEVLMDHEPPEGIVIDVDD